MEVSFKGLAEVVTAAAESLAKFAESIARVAQLSVAGYDEVKARRDYARLKELYVELFDYGLRQDETADRLKLFISRFDDEADEQELGQLWRRFVAQAAGLIERLQPIINDWERERADFVLDEAYATLRVTLYGRITVLHELVQMDRPRTSAEIAQVRDIQKSWDALISSLHDARMALGGHLSG